MATRRASDSDATSLDSLMDTLTNVVGILIIILASLQLDVSTKVREIVGVDLKATPEAVAKLQSESQSAAAERKTLEEKAATLTPEAVDERLSQLLAEAAKIRGHIVEADEKTLDPESLAREVEELRKQAKETEASLNGIEEQIAERRARLADTKQVSGPPPKIVRLPNPRNPPEGAKPIMFVCYGDRVSAIDLDAAVEFAVQTIKQRAIVSGTTCDCEKAAKVFADEDLGNEEFRLEIRDIDKIPHLVIHLRENKGTTAKQVRRSNSPFAKSLNQMNPERQYARFLVWPDSYEAYLAARIECDEKGIAAGWEPMSEKAEWIVNLGGQLQCKGYVPPPPPKNPPPPAPAPKRPTPADTID